VRKSESRSQRVGAKADRELQVCGRQDIDRGQIGIINNFDVAMVSDRPGTLTFGACSPMNRLKSIQ
jgi:hypothetical protein